MTSEGRFLLYDPTVAIDKQNFNNFGSGSVFLNAATTVKLYTFTYVFEI